MWQQRASVLNEQLANNRKQCTLFKGFKCLMTKGIWLISVSYFPLKQLQHREKAEFTYIADSIHTVLKSYGRHAKLVKRKPYRTTQRLIPTTVRCYFTSHPSKPAMLILVQFHLQNRRGRTGTNTGLVRWF